MGYNQQRCDSGYSQWYYVEVITVYRVKCVVRGICYYRQIYRSGIGKSGVWETRVLGVREQHGMCGRTTNETRNSECAENRGPCEEFVTPVSKTDNSSHSDVSY